MNPYCFDYRVLEPDGSERWLNSRGKLWRDENGKPIRMVGASLDINDRVLAARRVTGHAQRLEQLVPSATSRRWRCGKRWRTAGGECRDRGANQAKSEFLAHMSPRSGLR